MALSAIAENYFKTMTQLSAKVYEDVEDAKLAYENIWESLTEKEKTEIINESIIKPEISLKYALLDNLEFDLNEPLPVRNDDLMSFFGKDHGLKVIQDEHSSWRDEHSAPFLYQTKSQLNLCVLSEHRVKKDERVGSPPPAMSELEMSHSKVLSELKNALKSHDMLKSNIYKEKNETPEKEAIGSPTGFISKFIGAKFKSKDEDKERLVNIPQAEVVAFSDNSFKTNFKSPTGDVKFDKEYRSSVIKSNSDLSEEHRGLLSSASHGSSTNEFQSCEELTETTASTDTMTNSMLAKTGFDFLDNW